MSKGTTGDWWSWLEDLLGGSLGSSSWLILVVIVAIIAALVGFGGF